ncbi:Uncharacterised protein [Chryseobacterium indologenes]|nr:Uncharacterised protein [Chryseobacterium indologenes]
MTMMNIYTIVLSLLFVEEGYQYFHIDQKIYLVPQYHVIWISSGKAHKITSEAQTVNLMVFLFRSVFEEEFYQNVQVFAVATVLREMLSSVSKWNKSLIENEAQELQSRSTIN